jgi:hypothetical protein
MLKQVARLGLRIGLASAVALTMAASSPAHAGPVQFASFSTASGTPFTFTNNGPNASLGSNTNTVNFAFTSATGLTTDTHVATVAFSGGTSAFVGTSGSFFDQPINGATTDTITFNDTTNHQTLLSVTYTGDLTGQLGSSNASLGSSANVDVLAYSSALLVPNFFSLPSNFQISLPPDVSNSPGISGNLLSSFTSSGASGQFFTNPGPVVAAPASVVMFGTGMAAVALLVVRKHRERKVVPSAT